MTAIWTSQAIAAATKGRASTPFSARGVTFDSREVVTGDLFIAMRGETTDGHRFIAKAIAAGAAGILCEEPVDHPHVQVADGMAALEDMGRASRARSDAVVIGVTGSAGKTGTKEALAAALDRCAPGQTHRSVKSYNNHTGVPLSLARMPADARYGVLEMGMNHAGELAALTRMVRPHIAIVTTIAPAHRQFFRSDEDIADAKGEIFEGLEPGGTAIIPFDNPHYDRLRAKAEQHAARVISFGLKEGADVRALDWVADGQGGSLITARLPDTTICFTVAHGGDHWVANAMAVMAAVYAAGGDLAAAGVALAELPGLPGRGARHVIDVGVPSGTARLIDESYNANPASMAATIGQLGLENATRRIAVLGAMRELGEGSAAYHAALADHLAAADVAHVVLVGDEMAPLAARLAAGGLERAVDFAHVPGVDAAEQALAAILRPGDAVLVKGSNSVGLSRLVANLVSGVVAGPAPAGTTAGATGARDPAAGVT